MLVFVVPADHRVKVKTVEKRDKYLDLARELEKLLSMKVPVMLIVIDALGKVTKRFVEGLEEPEIITGRDHPNDSTIKIGQNTEKSPGDLRSLKL